LKVPAALRLNRLSSLWRYYQAGVVNTVFGYGCYALLLKLGLGMYLAQLIAHVAGVAFNYLTYSRHVFPEAGAAKMRFVLSYAGNYLMGLAALAAASTVFASPYVAGLVAIVVVSLLNFFVLKHLVFTRKAAP
jgi:putative flippase GtrA